VKVHTPRLRMFAGPNGSGKSTLKTVLPLKLLGVYLNPDEIEQEIREKGFLDLTACRVTVEPHKADEALEFFRKSDLMPAWFKRAVLDKIQTS